MAQAWERGVASYGALFSDPRSRLRVGPLTARFGKSILNSMSPAIWQVDTDPESTMVLKDPGAQRAFFDARRQRILKSLVVPASAVELAERLEEPASRLYYHLRLLERHGLIHPVGERQVRSNREVIYGLAAERFEADVDDKLAVELGFPAKAFAEAARRHAAGWGRDASPRIMDWTSLELGPDEAKQFRARFLSLVEETRQAVAAKHRTRRPRLSVFLAVFPDEDAPE